MIETSSLGFDPFTGIEAVMHYDTVTDAITLEHRSAVDAVIEANKDVAREQRSDWKGDMHLVASIPAVVAQKLQADGILDDPKRLKAWLEDRDNRVFRVKQGRI